MNEHIISEAMKFFHSLCNDMLIRIVKFELLCSKEEHLQHRTDVEQWKEHNRQETLLINCFNWY